MPRILPGDSIDDSVFESLALSGQALEPEDSCDHQDRNSPPSLQRQQTDARILHADFRSWAAAYNGPRFNVLHMDMDLGPLALDLGYNEVLFGLAENWPRLIAPSTNILHWVPGWAIEPVIELYHDWSRAYAFRVEFEPDPLVWHKTYLPEGYFDGANGFRPAYETALLVSIGGARLVRSIPNIVAHKNPPGKPPTPKPVAVLSHFLSAIVDGTSLVLDPACGNGGAIAAAVRLKAKAAVGIEGNPNRADSARLHVKRTLALTRDPS